VRAHTLIYVTSRRLAFRFVTSVVLGIAYGRRILDLKEEMVSFNHKSIDGKYIEMFLGEPDSNCDPQSSNGKFEFEAPYHD
jgi:hypothetical protein